MMIKILLIQQLKWSFNSIHFVNMIDKPKDEVVYLPCRECKTPLPVNVVYVPYLNGQTGCAPHRCPKKMT